MDSTAFPSLANLLRSPCHVSLVSHMACTQKIIRSSLRSSGGHRNVAWGLRLTRKIGLVKCCAEYLKDSLAF